MGFSFLWKAENINIFSTNSLYKRGRYFQADWNSTPLASKWTYPVYKVYVPFFKQILVDKILDFVVHCPECTMNAYSRLVRVTESESTDL